MKRRCLVARPALLGSIIRCHELTVIAYGGLLKVVVVDFMKYYLRLMHA